jgi:hypothetical protein
VDTHTDTHTACLLDSAARALGIVPIEASRRGYAELIAWALDHAPAHGLVWAGELPLARSRLEPA